MEKGRSRDDLQADFLTAIGSEKTSNSLVGQQTQPLSTHGEDGARGFADDMAEGVAGHMRVPAREVRAVRVHHNEIDFFFLCCFEDADSGQTERNIEGDGALGL